MSPHNHTTARVLDLRGLACPLPVLKTRKALMAMAPGEVLDVLATDPVAARDIPEYAESAGHTLLAIEHDRDVWRFRVRRG